MMTNKKNIKKLSKNNALTIQSSHIVIKTTIKFIFKLLLFMYWLYLYIIVYVLAILIQI
jgi:hypothetical protein